MHASGTLNSKGANNPMSGKTILETWVSKFGEDEARRLYEEHKTHCSAANFGSKNGMFGKRHADSSRQKMSEFRVGKSHAEMWGVEKAEAYRLHLQEIMSGSGNPMFGKTSSGGRSVKGRYKGLFFRSLLEYSFMKYLEAEGWDLTRDVEYEKIRVRVNETMTYCPDFHVPSTKTVYEVKPFKVSLSVTNQLKFEAAQRVLGEQGLSFRVMTEKDFDKVSFADALKDPDIVFDERTFKYFKKG